MRDVVNEPRECLEDPAAFGRRSGQWRVPPHARDAARVRAARLQHDVARHVRAFLEGELSTQGEFAGRLGWRRERLARILTGQVWTTLTDLEELVGAAEETLPNLMLRALDPTERGGAAKTIVTRYLEAQVQMLQGDTARSAPARPSMRPPLH